MGRSAADPVVRFWSKVDRFGPVVRADLGCCWVWTGSLNSQHANKVSRYGQFFVRKVNGKTQLVSAHRFSWEIENGPVPAGSWVLHHCDNGPCVRPSHLFLGDHAVNMADMKAKGRTRATHPEQRGERHPRHKLTEQDVRYIRASIGNLSYRELALRFGVGKSMIWAIAKGRSWGWL